MTQKVHQSLEIARARSCLTYKSAMRAMGGVLAFAGSALHVAMAADVAIAEQKLTSTTSYTYYSTGRPATQTIEPDGGNSLTLTTKYTYDAATGNKLTEVVSGWNGSAAEDRAATTGWDSSGRFATTRSNALSHAETLDYDPAFGGVIKHIDANGQKTVWEYDAFGRKKLEKRGYSRPDADDYTDYTIWTYERCADISGGCNSVEGVAAAYVVTATVRSSSAVGGGAEQQIAPITKTYYDVLNRPIRIESQALGDGTEVKTVYRDTVYDTRGNLWKVSQPYFAGGTSKWTEVLYDNLGRKVHETAPNSQVTSISYSVLTTTVSTTVAGIARVSSSTRDARDLIVKSTDAKSNATNYVYTAHGKLSHAINPYGNTVEIGYDLRGRRVSLNDPDLGAWSYSPNAFGEVVSQTSALGKIGTMAYDRLGRLTKRSDTDLETSFEYDPANGKGQLAKVYTTSGYCREHGYDSLSRPSASTLKIGTGSTACTSPTQTWVASTSYDSLSRVSAQTFPTGMKVKQVYDGTLGALIAVKSYVGNVEGTVYWSRSSGDAAGRSTGYTYGNGVATALSYDEGQMGWLKAIYAGSGGNAALADIQLSKYEYDSTGQLSKREDKFDLPNALSERFEVDVLGRLKTLARYSGETEVANSRVTLEYDAIGRIKSKTDVGTYYYAGAVSGQPRPHAVTGVRGTVEADYVYDAGGNMTSGDSRSYLYTDAGLLRMAGKGNGCQEFLTQGEGMRWQQVIYGAACRQTAGQPDNGASVELARTLYMHPDATNGLSFERETKSGVASYKHYITVGGRPVVLVLSSSATVNANTALTTNYLHYDHLGSIVAVTNTSGAAIERRSFDSWGRPRELNGAQGSGELPNGLAGEATDRAWPLYKW
jgi:YD repeat-containing protein